jgi:hypothetical protein
MNNKNLSLAGIILLASILSSCDLVGDGPDSAIRQSNLTISETPLFYYKATTSNKYYLTLSNNTDQQLSLVDSSITNNSLAESIDFRSMVDTSECNKLAAKSDCRLRIKLPYANNEGYYSFRMNYQANDGTDIYVDKVIAFSSSFPESGGLVSSQKFIDTVAVNSDRFTLALPIILDRDYSAIKLEVGNKNERSAYSKIVCDTQGGYKQNSSCTALVELDGHIADPQLRLSTTDTNGHINSYNFVTGVVFNNLPHLVYLNAPIIVRSGSSGASNTVTVLNIGTLVASNLKTAWINSSNLSLTQSSSCLSGGHLLPNSSCNITYTPQTPPNPVFGSQLQNVEYSGGALSTTKDKFYVYRNKAALLAPKVVSITPAANLFLNEVNPEIRVNFSEPVDSDTVDNNSFYLTASSGQKVNGVISWIDNNSIAFIPTADLMRGAQYTINLATSRIGNSAGKISTQSGAIETSKFNINAPVVTVVADSSTNIMMGDSFHFTASINAGSSVVTAAFVNPLHGVITSNPTSCNLNAAGTKSCIFSAVLAWNTSLPNGLSVTFYPQIMVRATNNATITGSPLNLTVVNNSIIYLPATGQTANLPIGATEGMDGWYKTGVTVNPRFTVETNCITDNLTGLMWVRDLRMVNSGGILTWQDALNLIDNANKGTGYCGYKDWHLPTVSELNSLNNYGQSNIADWLNTQGFLNVRASPGYWSSTTFAPDSNDAWSVFFDTGLVGTSGKSRTGVVWPVRGG